MKLQPGDLAFLKPPNRYTAMYSTYVASDPDDRIVGNFTSGLVLARMDSVEGYKAGLIDWLLVLDSELQVFGWVYAPHTMGARP